MISGADLNEVRDKAPPPPPVTLPPKRRSKLISDADSLTVPMFPSSSRRTRMKRSGKISWQWKNESGEPALDSVSVSRQNSGCV